MSLRQPIVAHMQHVSQLAERRQPLRPDVPRPWPTDGPRRTPDPAALPRSAHGHGPGSSDNRSGTSAGHGQVGGIGKFKVPTLRALPSHAPYFHNGSAPTTADVWTSTNRRFTMRLSPQERSDLRAFLDSL